MQDAHTQGPQRLTRYSLSFFCANAWSVNGWLLLFVLGHDLHFFLIKFNVSFENTPSRESDSFELEDVVGGGDEESVGKKANW